jgi:hypothetical protein
VEVVVDKESGRVTWRARRAPGVEKRGGHPSLSDGSGTLILDTISSHAWSFDSRAPSKSCARAFVDKLESLAVCGKGTRGDQCKALTGNSCGGTCDLSVGAPGI